MTYQDTTPKVADVMGHVSHSQVAIPIEKIRPLRGRAFVEVYGEIESIIIMPDSDPTERTWYRGRILALGKPACVGHGGPEVPWSCGVGDEIVFVLFVWMDRMRITSFVGVRGKVAVIAQGEILAKVERP